MRSITGFSFGVAATTAVNEALWLSKTFENLHMKPNTDLYLDNQKEYLQLLKQGGDCCKIVSAALLHYTDMDY